MLLFAVENSCVSSALQLDSPPTYHCLSLKDKTASQLLLDNLSFEENLFVNTGMTNSGLPIDSLKVFSVSLVNSRTIPDEESVQFP